MGSKCSDRRCLGARNSSVILYTGGYYSGVAVAISKSVVFVPPGRSSSLPHDTAAVALSSALSKVPMTTSIRWDKEVLSQGPFVPLGGKADPWVSSAAISGIFMIGSLVVPPDVEVELILAHDLCGDVAASFPIAPAISLVDLEHDVIAPPPPPSRTPLKPILPPSSPGSDASDAPLSPPTAGAVSAFAPIARTIGADGVRRGRLRGTPAATLRDRNHQQDTVVDGAPPAKRSVLGGRVAPAVMANAAYPLYRGVGSRADTAPAGSRCVRDVTVTTAMETVRASVLRVVRVVGGGAAAVVPAVRHLEVVGVAHDGPLPLQTIKGGGDGSETYALTVPLLEVQSADTVAAAAPPAAALVEDVLGMPIRKPPGLSGPLKQGQSRVRSRGGGSDGGSSAVSCTPVRPPTRASVLSGGSAGGGGVRAGEDVHSALGGSGRGGGGGGAQLGPLASAAAAAGDEVAPRVVSKVRTPPRMPPHPLAQRGASADVDGSGDGRDGEHAAVVPARYPLTVAEVVALERAVLRGALPVRGVRIKSRCRTCGEAASTHCEVEEYKLPFGETTRGTEATSETAAAIDGTAVPALCADGAQGVIEGPTGGAGGASAHRLSVSRVGADRADGAHPTDTAGGGGHQRAPSARSIRRGGSAGSVASSAASSRLRRGSARSGARGGRRRPSDASSAGGASDAPSGGSDRTEADGAMRLLRRGSVHLDRHGLAGLAGNFATFLDGAGMTTSRPASGASAVSHRSRSRRGSIRRTASALLRDGAQKTVEPDDRDVGVSDLYVWHVPAEASGADFWKAPFGPGWEVDEDGNCVMPTGLGGYRPMGDFEWDVGSTCFTGDGGVIIGDDFEGAGMCGVATSGLGAVVREAALRANVKVLSG